MKKALITGITGQDGSYLAEFLIEKNYKVIGLRRKTSTDRPDNLEHLRGKIDFVYGDLLDTFSLMGILKEYNPDEIYNLASQSYPGESWRLAIETGEITGLGAHRLFEALREAKTNCRVYQASSSEMFGEPEQIPQNEKTSFAPVNPYAAAKLYAHHIANIYSKSYNLFISCGILFNHESPRRGVHFLSQKVTYAAACLKLGIMNSSSSDEGGQPIVKNGKISLGNLDARRDWGFAGDYVEAMWMMLQHDKPDDFVIGTGEIRTVRQFCDEAFRYVGLDWQDYVQVDSRLFRPIETGPTVADASKAREVLGWKPRTSFSEMVSLMVENHLQKLKQDAKKMPDISS
jgi:GDPmannose 4,6-dehydratase